MSTPSVRLPCCDPEDTIAILPRSYVAAERMLDRLTLETLPSDALLAAAAIKADIEDGARKWPDGSIVVRSNLTDTAQDALCLRQFLDELREALLGGDDARLKFATWFCTWYSAEVAAHVRRCVAGEIET